jgi:hypothetical protein
MSKPWLFMLAFTWYGLAKTLVIAWSHEWTRKSTDP